MRRHRTVGRTSRRSGPRRARSRSARSGWRPQLYSLHQFGDVVMRPAPNSAPSRALPRPPARGSTIRVVAPAPIRSAAGRAELYIPPAPVPPRGGLHAAVENRRCCFIGEAMCQTDRAPITQRAQVNFASIRCSVTL